MPDGAMIEMERKGGREGWREEKRNKGVAGQRGKKKINHKGTRRKGGGILNK